MGRAHLPPMRLLLACLVCLPAAAPAKPAKEQAIQVGSDRFVKYRLESGKGPPVEYYISKPARPTPLALYIQGSGCAPAFIEMQPGNHSSTIFSLTTTAHRGEFAVMVVDKPYAAPRFPKSGGLATDCSRQFNEYFSLENWVRHLDTAFRHALRRPWVVPGRTLVIGNSEGATAAAALAAADDKVTDVALVGGSGPGQFYDFLARSYESHDSDEARLADIATLEGQLREIGSDPDSGTRFAWGHSFKRWSSFFRASSLENLRRSRARVYLVSGMADESVPILSSEVLYSELAVAGRDVQFRRVPTADHNLVPAGSDFGRSMPQIEAEYVRITDWFHAGRAAR